MTFTVSQLVDDTLTKLEGTAHTEINLLEDDVAESTTNAVSTVTLRYDLGGCVIGVYLSMDDEAMLVIAVNEALQTADVLRGRKGSAAAAHTAGTVIEVDPPWPRWMIMEELQTEIRSWGPQVFRVAQTDITLSAPPVLGYDLGDLGPVFRVLDCRMTAPTLAGQMIDGSSLPVIGATKEWPRVQFQDLIGNAPLTDFPSGNALILDESRITIPGTLHMTYGCPFDVDSSWSDTTDLVLDVGLHTSDLDIPAFGVAWRCMAYRQPRRLFTQTQGQPRDAQEIPALALLQAAEQFKQIRDSRLLDAQARLLSNFPHRIRR